MKKVISVFLAALFVFSCINLSFIPVNAITDYTTGVTEDGFDYIIDNETGELTVTWVEDYSITDLVIPSYIDGHPVTAIGAHFLGDTQYENVRSVVIPDTVTRIEYNAFADRETLESVVMSKNIEYVGDCVFANTELTNNAENWGDGALYIGNLLYGVSLDYSGVFTIKDGTTSIAPFCFSSRSSWHGCDGITDVIIPDSVKYIGLRAFCGCTGLESITIPDSVTYIDNVAFDGCSNLTDINIDASSLKYIGQDILRETAYYYDDANWQNDVLYLDSAALCGRNTISNLKIKEGTEIIADYAFACNDNIVSVSLPDSMRIICDLAFDDLHALPSIELPDGIEYIGKSAFDGCDLLTELDIPFSVNYIGLFAFNRTDKLEKLIIRNPHCTIIDNHEEYAGGAYSVNTNTTVYGEEGSTAETFANNNGVDFVALFSQSGKTGSRCMWTFDNVSGTLSISNTSNYYDSIDSYTYGKAPWFSFRESIKTVIVEGMVYSVGANAFAGCEALETVIMPEVYDIGDYAFSGCISLKSIELSSKNSTCANIGKNAFSCCTSLTKIIIPYSNVNIGEYAFYCCENLNTLGLYCYATIGNNAFAYCTKLVSIYMVDNGSPLSGTISNNAFSGVTANVYYFDNYSPSQDSRFGGQFNYIKMTSGIIGYNAYWHYDQSNETLTISGTGKLFEYTSGSDLPWMVYNYGGGYTYVSNIKTIIIENGINEIPSYSFEYMRNVESVNLPNTLLRLQPNAFNNCESLTEITLPASLENVDGKWYWYRCPNLNDVYYVGTEQEWNEVYVFTNGNDDYRITPHFLVYHPATQSCTVAGYPAHYEFDGTSNTTFYDLNKVAIPTPEPDKLNHHFNGYWTKDSNSHWHTCTLCGTAISDKADHKFDNACDEICNICGYKRTIEHNYSTEYTSDENSHWRVCKVCSDKTDFGSHIWDEGKVTKAPSCTDIGIRTYTCSVCKKTRTEEIDATGHTVVIDKAKPATCTKTGLTEGSHCSVCGEIIKAQEIIPATGHTEVIDKGTAPTCTETGLTEGSHCSICDEIIKAQEIIPATGHTEVIDKGKAPTCTETGLTEGSHCSVCGEVIKAQEIIPAIGHTEVIDKAKAPTCTKTGLTEGSHCSVCGEIIKAQEIVPATGHTPAVDKAKSATCTETGLTEGSHCSVCSEVIKAQEIVPATGHTMVIDKAKAPTCTETGLTEGSHCSVCGEIIKAQEIIPATGHTEVIDKAKPATCTETGLTKGSHCSVCGEVIKAQSVIPATGHTEVIDKGKAPTCTETGLTDGSHCSVCGEVIKAQSVIPATGHTEVIDKAKPATCTESGLTEGSHCSVCGEIIKAQEIIPATGHDWDNGTVTKAADCHHDGEMTYSCSKCQEKKTEVIPMLEHQWNDGTVTKEPTYTEPGEIKYTCSLCGDTRTESVPCKEKKGKLTISNETVRAGDEVTVKLYLDENPGITALSINVNFPNRFILKDVQYMGLFPNQPSSSPMNYNPFTVSWASPTSTDIDNTGLFAILTFDVGIDVPLADYPITVTYNAENVFDSAFVNVPLDIENSTVSVLKPTPGDVNRDGNINMKDLVLIQQLINRWDVQIVESAADVNDDGEINMKDLVLLQRYINGWEVVLK